MRPTIAAGSGTSIPTATTTTTAATATVGSVDTAEVRLYFAEHHPVTILLLELEVPQPTVTRLLTRDSINGEDWQSRKTLDLAAGGNLWEIPEDWQNEPALFFRTDEPAGLKLGRRQYFDITGQLGRRVRVDYQNAETGWSDADWRPIDSYDIPMDPYRLYLPANDNPGSVVYRVQTLDP